MKFLLPLSLVLGSLAANSSTLDCKKTFANSPSPEAVYSKLREVSNSKSNRLTNGAFNSLDLVAINESINGSKALIHRMLKMNNGLAIVKSLTLKTFPISSDNVKSVILSVNLLKSDGKGGVEEGFLEYHNNGNYKIDVRKSRENEQLIDITAIAYPTSNGTVGSATGLVLGSRSGGHIRFQLGQRTDGELELTPIMISERGLTQVLIDPLRVILQ